MPWRGCDQPRRFDSRRRARPTESCCLNRESWFTENSLLDTYNNDHSVAPAREMGNSLPSPCGFVGESRAEAFEQGSWTAIRSWCPRPGFYLSFTNSRTKMAHTPTVNGNCTSAVSRTDPPLGSRKVSKYIATAVSIPSTSLLFQVMIVSLSLASPRGCSIRRFFARAESKLSNQSDPRSKHVSGSALGRVVSTS